MFLLINAATDEEHEVDVSDEEFLQFDTSSVPVIITLTKMGQHYIIDATSEEESQMSSAVLVSVNRHDQICGAYQEGRCRAGPKHHLRYAICCQACQPAAHLSLGFRDCCCRS